MIFYIYGKKFREKKKKGCLFFLKKNSSYLVNNPSVYKVGYQRALFSLGATPFPRLFHITLNL